MCECVLVCVNLCMCVRGLSLPVTSIVTGTVCTGNRIPMRSSVEYVSFAAHADYPQTSDFISKLRAPHVVLVHGERYGTDCVHSVSERV